MSDGNPDPITPDDDSLSSDEKSYLQALCSGPKSPTEIANELTDKSQSGDYKNSETIENRLNYLVGREEKQLVERSDDGKYKLTNEGEEKLC